MYRLAPRIADALENLVDCAAVAFNGLRHVEDIRCLANLALGVESGRMPTRYRVRDSGAEEDRYYNARRPIAPRDCDRVRH